MSAAAGWARFLGRVFLRLYPKTFRRAHGDAYLEGALHIFGREQRNAGSVRGLWRLVRILAADAWTAAPGEWRSVWTGSVPRAGLAASAGAFAVELRQAVRGLFRRPGYTLLVVGTLGLGIGVSAAVFGALDRVVLRPLPYPDGDRLVYLSMREVELGWQMAPWGEVVERWRAGARTVESIETYRELSVVRTGDGAASVLSVTGYSAGLPPMLGVRPLLGRLPARSDAQPSAAPVIALSEQYWRRAWGADRGVVGGTIRLNDTIYTVAGVWPASARLDFDGAPDLFRVLPAKEEAPRGDFTLVLAKLARGATSDLVESELAGMLGGIEDVGPNMRPGINAPYGFLGEAYVRGLWLVFVGGLILMVVAIANAANLVLGRSASRLREIGIRSALGGSRSRLLQLFLAESAALAAAGVAAGLGVAIATQRVLAALEPGRLVPAGTTGVQSRTVLFAAVLAALSALVCAAVPLLQLRGTGGASLAQLQGTRVAGGRSRLRTVLIAAQTALAVLLVCGAGLVSRSFISALRVDTGMAMDRLVVVAARLSGERYEDPAARAAYFDRARAALETLPGSDGVTVAPNPPLSFSVRGGLPFLDGEAEPVLTGPEFVSSTSAEPNFFDVAGVRIVAGRAFERGERGVVIVNESFARAHGGGVVGRGLRFPGDTVSRTIVGVASDVRAHGLASSATQLYYSAAGESEPTYQRFLIRTASSPEAFLTSARARLSEIDRDVPLREATTGAAMIRAQTSRFRFLAFLLGSFAALGVVFAVAGVYGAVALDVHRRVREVGVRMALGASHGSVVKDVLRRGLTPVAFGAMAGITAALWAAPLLESLLFEVSARDPVSGAAAVAIVIVTAALACVVPARRAARVDPAITLRAE